MIRVMAFGTFDIFHPGHESYLRQAKGYGDYLLVVVARDATVKKIKGKQPINEETIRLKKVQASQIAEEVVLGDLIDPYKILEQQQPAVICLGYDQQGYADNLAAKIIEIGLRNTKIVRLKPFQPEIYKSSKLT